MLDPEGSPASAPAPDESVTPPTEPPSEPRTEDWPALSYWAGTAPTAGTPPAAGSDAGDTMAAPPWGPPPPPPAWTRTYELPTARTVVSAGLQLAVSTTRQIRRASIYIGLLSLGAFGPAVILLLVGVGRLLSDPGTAESLGNNPFLIFFQQPEILAAFGLVYVLFAVGLILLIAIGIDAQAIAISLLAGAASGQPLRLWEAILRARQVFWRLAGAGTIVGIASGVVSLIVTIPFLRPVDSNQGISFIGQMIGILAVTPFTFVATGIVLGDVGVVESLRRSVELFRARKRVALVVTLFALVASAIQTFAISAGLDLSVRVAQFLHLGLDQGGPAPVLLGAIVLAFIVAFGSLSFTVAAIVAAPQVAGFLGLTFYSGGLDKARVEGDAKPRGFRWVTVPMLITIFGLAVVGALGLPAMASFDLPKATPVLAFLRSAAPAGQLVSTYGASTQFEDLSPEPATSPESAADILRADYGYLPDVPAWLLSGRFDCSATDVSCSVGGSQPQAFDDKGAFVFVQRMAARPPSDARKREWGAVLRLDGASIAARSLSFPFRDASHVVITRLDGGVRQVSLFEYDGRTFAYRPTASRSLWAGNDLITLIPYSELPAWPLSWDMYAFESFESGGGRFDSLREGDFAPMLEYLEPPYYAFSGFARP